ncbi:Cell division protein FtsN [Ruegeria halocynthiae]|uniref:Cell division protein FtsN n=1 Tax=Ruegeria halocynthiae TaxID=985054 RepID=A0A1H2RPL2_9RHOB|nr:SPOR domain-containing protein [Ruegeria halocynthiae]SDW21287.1 Cell division protein FtsN [Ruegeria halocynthiae]
MKRATGTRFGPQRLAVLVVTLAALTGCEEGLIPQEASPEEAAAENADNTNRFELFPEAASGKQRDIEAPEVFQVTEAGLWDGRPSLGGIWVAHPDVAQPERVLIKNTANNKSVTGALFRRERNLPGPALQISSSAAEQLGMLAGAPTKVQVVALRRETVEEPPAPVESELTEDGDVAEGTDAADETADGEAPEKPEKRKWWQKKPADESNAGAAVVAGTAAGAAVASSDDETADAQSTELTAADPQAPEKPEKRKWWQKKPADETSAAATGAAAATVTAAEIDATPPEPQTTNLSVPKVTPPAEKPAKRKWWQKKNPNEITETQLDPIAGAAAAIEASEPTAPIATSAAAAGGLSKPYVQAGTFSVEANAKSAAEKLRRNGMTANVFELNSGDKSVWRVLVGPVATRTERRALLNDVKDLGFTDAFTSKN